MPYIAWSGAQGWSALLVAQAESRSTSLGISEKYLWDSLTRMLLLIAIKTDGAPIQLPGSVRYGLLQCSFGGTGTGKIWGHPKAFLEMFTADILVQQRRGYQTWCTLISSRESCLVTRAVTLEDHCRNYRAWVKAVDACLADPAVDDPSSMPYGHLTDLVATLHAVEDQLLGTGTFSAADLRLFRHGQAAQCGISPAASPLPDRDGFSISW